MDEDEFPFEDHDLGSLNGAPMLDVDENGYVVFPSEDSVDGYYDVLDMAEDEDENCYDGIYSDESFDSDCHVTECPALMQFEDEKLYDDHYSEDLIDSDSPVLNLPAQNAVLEDIENNPGMSVSAGQDDNEGLRDVSQNDLWDMFLYAAEIGRVDKLRNMLAECPDLVSRSNEGGYTALHRAARNNHLEAVSFLLENGADPNARNVNDWTPLHLATHWGNHRIVERLISQGVDVNAHAGGSMTALHIAVSNPTVKAENVLQVIRHLLGAPDIDVSVRSESGDTPMDLAQRKSEAIYMLLKEHLDR